MKVETWKDEGKPIGIKLTAENSEDEKILERFFDGGAKVNSYTPSTKGDKLTITFKDLIGK